MTDITMKSESWKPVPGYSNYEVSNTGEVRKTDGHIMSQHFCNGYLRVALRSCGTRKHFLVHRLVALAFIGPCPDGKQVNHIDESRTNNNLSNLEYVSPKENINHGSCLDKRAASRSKPVTQFSFGHKFIKTYPSIKEASLQLGISSGNICSCCRGVKKSAGGFIWAYENGGKK